MIIRFQDYKSPEGDVQWLFRKEACMHCTHAGCVTVCPTGTLYYKKEFGTIGIDKAKCISCRGCSFGCPFGVPKYDRKTGKISKCDMCATRISNNMNPACVKACPTGALQWLDKEEAIKIAGDRVRQLGGDANIYGNKFVGGTHLIYIFKEKADVYDGIHKHPEIPLSAYLWKILLKPFSIF
jgi:formate dehydrogenase iron-sulfur subunit